MTVNAPALFDAWAAAEQAARSVIAPLRNEADYQDALDTLALLWEEKQKRPELGTLLGLLSERIKTYETHAYPMAEMPANKVLAFLMTQRGVSQLALSDATGINQSNLSRLLSGERNFTTAHIRLLAHHFQVNPAVFL